MTFEIYDSWNLCRLKFLTSEMYDFWSSQKPFIKGFLYGKRHSLHPGAPVRVSPFAVLQDMTHTPEDPRRGSADCCWCGAISNSKSRIEDNCILSWSRGLRRHRHVMWPVLTCVWPIWLQALPLPSNPSPFLSWLWWYSKGQDPQKTTTISPKQQVAHVTVDKGKVTQGHKIK